MRKILFTLGTLLLSLAVPQVYADNVIINGTFDDNTTGWTGDFYYSQNGGGGFPGFDTQPYFWVGNAELR